VGFAENLDKLTSQRMKLITVKICLRSCLEEGSEDKFRKLEELVKKNGINLDNDALALFSEACLVFGMHPLVVASRYLEQGMKINNITINNSEEDNSSNPEPHFGCLIQGAKIMYQLQEKSQSNMEALLERVKKLI
jgi:hypothetical protein